MKVTRYLLFTVLILLSSTTRAESFEPHPYFGIGYTYADADVYGTSIDNGLLGAIFGYKFHPNFGVDLRAYGNVSDDEVYGTTVKIERSFSILAKGIIPANEYIYFYGLLGFADSKVKASDIYGSVSDSDEDLQYGVGMAISKGKSAPLEIQIEWMSLYDEDDVDITGFNINAVYNFF
ncbi:porin family protein [Vibrio sp. EA2]|uniref:porin family protein n=1 Tax=Vibrio sp. EA2 TaxID=3079860 RepID=UPI002948F6D4|nr:porin family protein [Vibrio sp. EA2]MDV6250680.1 porin family protein [Vibrio sp. EA2]